MFIIILLERGYAIYILHDFKRRIVLFNERFFKIFQELILPLDNDNNQSLAFPLSENGNNLSLTISFSTFLIFYISHISKKLCECIDASSLTLPPNCSLVMILSSPGLTLKESAFILGDVIGLAMN
jgi:hypothetical protein